MTTTNKLTQVPTGNGEPDLYRDAAGYAHWADGSSVTTQDIANDESNVLSCTLRAYGLKAFSVRFTKGSAARVDL